MYICCKLFLFAGYDETERADMELQSVSTGQANSDNGMENKDSFTSASLVDCIGSVYDGLTAKTCKLASRYKCYS